MFFVFKQKTAYEMRISDWSSDLFSSDLNPYGDFSFEARKNIETIELQLNIGFSGFHGVDVIIDGEFGFRASTNEGVLVDVEATPRQVEIGEELRKSISARSEEHTSELQSLMRNSYAVFLLPKKNAYFSHITIQ